MTVLQPTTLARADAAAFDAWSEVTHLAVMLRQRGMRETGDRFDGIIQMVGSTLHAMQFELDAKNTARPTPELTRRALGLFPERLLDPDREWVTGEGGTGFEGASYTVRGGKVTIFVTTEAGALAHRIDWRRRAATRERCDRWECENPGKRVMRTHRAFRHPASRFDQSNPEHGAFVTFTRKQILAAVAEQSGPQQMELAL